MCTTSKRAKCGCRSIGAGERLCCELDLWFPKIMRGHTHRRAHVATVQLLPSDLQILQEAPHMRSLLVFVWGIAGYKAGAVLCGFGDDLGRIFAMDVVDL